MANFISVGYYNHTGFVWYGLNCCLFSCLCVVTRASAHSGLPRGVSPAVVGGSCQKGMYSVGCFMHLMIYSGGHLGCPSTGEE